METERSTWHPLHYAIEFGGLATFMIVAGSLAVVIADVPAPLSRAIFGLAMGATAAAIIYSPWGARSGAHLNPAVTLTFAALGKIRRNDALGYIAAQFAGGIAGTALVAAVAGRRFVDPPTHAIVTQPGTAGVAAAFVAEALMTFVLMTVVLTVSNAGPKISRCTGAAAATLVALFITFEAPISGMSMNPARTFGSAAIAGDFTQLWVYFTAPPLGMLLAALAFVLVRRPQAVRCGRLNHTGPFPCIFRCGIHDAPI